MGNDTPATIAVTRCAATAPDTLLRVTASEPSAALDAPFAKLSIFFPMWNEEAYIARAVGAATTECERLVAAQFAPEPVAALAALCAAEPITASAR